MTKRPEHFPVGFDPKILDEYPYLQMTEAELLGMFEGDAVLRDYDTRIQQFNEKIADYERRRAEHRDAMAVIEAKEDELSAELKRISTEKRELRGADKSMAYHITLAHQRIREREKAAARRKKLLFHLEVKRRLNQMGRELKLNMGRRKQQGSGIEAVPAE